jgi:hypothetical protein
MQLMPQRTVVPGAPYRPARALAVVALGLILFAAGLRAFHAPRLPAAERAGASVVDAGKSHTKGCGVCVASTQHLVLDPRVPSLSPPAPRAGAHASFVSVLAPAPADVGRPIRAPPAA